MMLIWRMVCRALVLMALLSGLNAIAANLGLVDEGRKLYDGTVAITGTGPGACVGCHFFNPPPSTSQGITAPNHNLAANNPSRISNAFTVNATMTFSAITASELFKLALHIGQFKAPTAVLPKQFIGIKSGAASGKSNVYALLPTNGTSGVASDSGLSAVLPGGATGSVAAVVNNPNTSSIEYNITYTPAANFVGTETVNYKIANPAAPTPTANQVDFTVYGLLPANTYAVTAVKGQTYAAGTLYTVQTNDPAASNFSGNTTGLPAGLSINAAGQIFGTTNVAPGTYNGTVGFTTGSATVGNGSVTSPMTVTVAGITTAAAVNYSQNTAITPLNLASFPAAIGAVTITGTLPTGLSVVGNQLVGTPTQSGNFIGLTINANAGGTAVSLPFAITVGPIPVITTTPAIAASPAIYVAGVTNSALPSNIQINVANADGNTPGSYVPLQAALPAGLLISAGGLISGTPTASGDFPLTLGASNVNGQGTLNVILRINSSSAPNITSGLTAGATSLGVLNNNVYTVTADNGPIISYAIVAPSVLPPGLNLNVSNGVVFGTPSASGTFTTTLSATNSTPLTGSRLVTFTINPTLAPVITSPTFASLAVGVPITPIQVVASNPPILNYGVLGGSSLPAGLVLDAATGIISGTPTTPGPVTTTLTAANVINTGQLAVPFSIGVPAPSACVMAVVLNTATTIDLKPCMFPAFTPTGVSILATPAHGSVSVNGTTVTFTPTNNYFGPDTFTAVAYFAGGGTTTAGVVKVTVTGRPDPTRDPTVAAIVSAQTDTAQRFSRAQISNFQRRTESLHQSNDAAGAASTLRLQPRGDAPASLASLLPAASPVPNSDAYRASGAAGSQVVPATTTAASSRSTFDVARDAGMAATGAAPVAISQSQALDAVASGVGLKSLPFAEAVTQLLTTNSVNMANLVPSSGAPQPGATSFWVEGVASFGTKDASGATGAYEFKSDGITFGADRRINDKLVVGLGLGFGRDKTVIGTDGSQNEGRGLSLAVYGSYQPAPGTFIDAMLGVGSLDFDTRRYVVPINDFALGNRKGTQLFGSLTGGYEFRNKGVMFSPYARLDYSAERLQDSTESGAGAYALTFFDQTSSSLQGTLGARAESIHSTSFGWAIPRVRAELRHEFQSDRQAFISYADQIGGPRYGLATAGTGRDALVLGLGSDFIMRDGWTLGLDYQLTQTFGQASSYALQLKLSKDFDAKGLPKLVGNFSDEPSKPIDVQVDAGFMFDDNVTRAKAGPDKMFDSIYSVNIGKSEAFEWTPNSRFLLSGTVGGERFQNFNGLSRITAGVDGEYQYRESSEFDAPTWGLFGKLSVERFQSDLRDGYRTSFGASVRQPLTDRISLFGALSQNQRFSQSAVFSTLERALRLNADYTLSDRETLYATAEFRYGDIVSTGRPSLENISVAKVFVQDDAFAGGQFFSYKFEGRTVLTTLGYNIGFGPRDSIDFSWRRVESTPGLRPAFVTSPKSYIDNQWAITYLVRF